MGIDWFTFFAQVVNFLILAGLLWHFAYKPIVRAMDERESSIRQRLKEADEKREQADQKAEELDRKHAELDEQREGLLSQAREKAEQQRQQLMDEARQRVEQSESEWRRNLARQKQALVDDLRRRAGRHVVAAVQQLLRDMADAELEAQIVDVFRGRLRDIDQDTARDVRQALAEANGDVTVVSAFELSDEQRQQLREQINDLADGAAKPDFVTDEQLLCGIELQAGNRRVAWHAADYLRELSERIEKAVSSAAQQASAGGGDQGKASADPQSDEHQRDKHA